MRKVIIRLYRQFDVDLIYLFESLKETKTAPQILIKTIIREYISGKKKERNDYEITAHPKELRRKIQYHILLDEAKDRDILEWIDTITIGYRNTAIKGLIRSHIGYLALYPCLATTKLTFK